jgi:hypothetical protein
MPVAPPRRRPALTFAVVLCALVAAPLSAQARSGSAQENEAVRRALLDYVEGFYEGDSTKHVRSVWPEVRKWGYWRASPDSAYRGMGMPYARFMSFDANVRAGRTKTPANAPKVVEVFEVLDQTASGKVTAYWGVDYVLLAKESGRWMITHVLWQSPPPRAAR